MDRRHARAYPPATDIGRVKRPTPKGTKRKVPRKFPKRKLRTEAFFGFVFILIIIYVIGYLYTNIRRPEVSQMRVEMGAISRPDTFSGVIIRDEVVYRADDAGMLVFHVENLERVRSGSVVASIQDAAAVEAYRTNLAGIDRDAVNMQRMRSGVALNEDEVRARNQGIKRYVGNAAFELAAGGIDGVFALSETVRRGMESRNELYFGDEVVMRELTVARNQAVTGISGAISEVAAASSGIFSNTFDGLENQLSVNNLSNIPKEIIISGGGSPAFPNLGVERGDDLFRIIRSNDWYIVAFVCANYAEDWLIGSSVTLFVEDGASTIPLVVQINSLADMGQEFYVVFRTNNDFMRFVNTRNITFSLSRNTAEGFKIPHTAIVEHSHFPVPAEFVFIHENVRAVNVRTGANISREPVTGHFSVDGSLFYIMADTGRLRVGDTLTMDDDDFLLETIEALTGVFVTNMGVTLFRQVNLEGYFDANADYIILDPARNPNIRLFDRIAADARAVSNRLLLH